jgi:hypothetical protein
LGITKTGICPSKLAALRQMPSRRPVRSYLM